LGYQIFNTINYAGNKGEFTEFIPMYPKEVDLHYFGRGGLAGLLHYNGVKVHAYAMKIFKFVNPCKYYNFNYDLLYKTKERLYSDEVNDTTIIMRATFGVMGKSLNSVYFIRFEGIKDIIDEEVMKIYDFYKPVRKIPIMKLIGKLQKMPVLYCNYKHENEITKEDELALKLWNLPDGVLQEAVVKFHKYQQSKLRMINEVIEAVNTIRRKAFDGVIKMINYSRLVNELGVKNNCFFNHTFNPVSGCTSLDPPYLFTEGYETQWLWKDGDDELKISKDNADALCAIYNAKEILWFKNLQDRKFNDIILHEYFNGWAFIFKYSYVVFYGINELNSYEKVFSNKRLADEVDSLFNTYFTITEKDGCVLQVKKTSVANTYRIVSITFQNETIAAGFDKKSFDEYYDYRNILYSLSFDIREQLREAEDRIAVLQQFFSDDRTKTPYDLIKLNCDDPSAIQIDDTFFGNTPSELMLSYARLLKRVPSLRKSVPKRFAHWGQRFDLSYIYLLIKQKRLTKENVDKIKTMHEKQIVLLRRAVDNFKNRFSSPIISMVLGDDIETFNDTFTALETTLATLEAV